MTPDQLRARIETLSPGTQAQVTDLTGGMDHYRATVVSPSFVGKSLLEQHRMVMRLVHDEIQSGEVHALSLDTLTPAEASQAQA